jgi:hypothetical protein
MAKLKTCLVALIKISFCKKFFRAFSEMFLPIYSAKDKSFSDWFVQILLSSL